MRLRLRLRLRLRVRVRVRVRVRRVSEGAACSPPMGTSRASMAAAASTGRLGAAGRGRVVGRRPTPPHLVRVGVRVRIRVRVRLRVRVRVRVLTHARRGVLARSGLGEAPSPLGAARASNPKRRVRTAIDLVRIRVGDRVRD